MKSKKLLIASIFILLIAVFGLFLPTSATYYSQKPSLGVGINWAHPLARGLVACWIMNEGSGDKIFDLSGNGNDGALIDDPIWVPGRTGRTLKFDATDDYVDMGDVLDMEDSDFTISLWFKTDAVDSTTNYQLAKWESGIETVGWYITIYNATPGMFIRDRVDGDQQPNILTGATILVDTWYHLVFVIYEGGNGQGYLNGVVAGNPTDLSGIHNFQSASSLVVHAIVPTVGSSRVGLNDDVRIYNRGLSANEVAQLYRESYAMFKPIMNIAQLYGAITIPTGVSIPVAQEHYFQRRRR